MKQAFHGEVYDTATALLLARHEPPSGIEALKGQRVFDLYRTPSGSYFKYETTASLFVEDEQPEIIPIDRKEVLTLYNDFDDQQLELGVHFLQTSVDIRCCRRAAPSYGEDHNK